MNKIPAKQIFWIALLSANLPLLTIYFRDLWSIEYYGYFPALILALGMLVWSRWDKQLCLPERLQDWTLISAGLVLCVCATGLGSPWVSCLSWVLLTGAWLKIHQRNDQSGSLFALWPLSWLLIRLPLDYDDTLTSALRAIASRWASTFLDFFNVPHVLNGNVFILPSGSMFVEEACSGIQSMFTLLFVSVLIVAWLNRSVVLLPLYVATGIFWSLCMNTLRIVLIALVKHRYGWDWTHGWQHQLVGYLCLLVAVLLLMSSDRLLRILFFPIPENLSPENFNPLTSTWNRLMAASTRDLHATESRESTHFLAGTSRFWGLASTAFAAAIFILWVPQFSVALSTIVDNEIGNRSVIWPPPPTLFDSEKESLRSVAHSLARETNDPFLGVNADIWSASFEGIPVRIALSQPYVVFHDLTICYVNSGWKKNERTIATSAGVKASFVGQDGREGNLWFCGIDSTGGLVAPPDSWSLISRRLQNGGDASDKPCLMLQLWVETEVALTVAQRESLDGLFWRVEQIVSNAIGKPNG